jgi:hypothetical protein
VWLEQEEGPTGGEKRKRQDVLEVLVRTDMRGACPKHAAKGGRLRETKWTCILLSAGTESMYLSCSFGIKPEWAPVIWYPALPQLAPVLEKMLNRVKCDRARPLEGTCPTFNWQSAYMYAIS